MDDAEYGFSRGWVAALLTLGLGAGPICSAQGPTFTPSDSSRMMIRAQVCADEHASSDERLRACSAIIKDGGLREPAEL